MLKIQVQPAFGSIGIVEFPKPEVTVWELKQHLAQRFSRDESKRLKIWTQTRPHELENFAVITSRSENVVFHYVVANRSRTVILLESKESVVSTTPCAIDLDLPYQYNQTVLWNAQPIDSLVAVESYRTYEHEDVILCASNEFDALSESLKLGFTRTLPVWETALLEFYMKMSKPDIHAYYSFQRCEHVNQLVIQYGNSVMSFAEWIEMYPDCMRDYELELYTQEVEKYGKSKVNQWLYQLFPDTCQSLVYTLREWIDDRDLWFVKLKERQIQWEMEKRYQFE